MNILETILIFDEIKEFVLKMCFFFQIRSESILWSLYRAIDKFGHFKHLTRFSNTFHSYYKFRNTYLKFIPKLPIHLSY